MTYLQKKAAQTRQVNPHPRENDNRDYPEPKISIIIPIYGTERYIEKCLLSAMNQTLRDIEIICVDDASPDHSAAIVERLACKDQRIRLIRHQTNLGLGGARNTGIQIARAHYVTGIDSDDYIMPEMMERLWQASEQGGADIVACGMSLVDENDRLMYNVSFPSHHYRNDQKNIDIFNILTPSFCNKLWKKELFTTHKVTFPEDQYYEDLATSPRLLYFANDIRVIPDPLYCYVQREGSIISTHSLRHMLDYFRTFDGLADFLESEGISNRYRHSLQEMIGKCLAYHARCVLKIQNQQEAGLEYLRYLLMLKISYMCNNSKMRSLGSQDLQDLLLKATSPLDLEIEN